MRQSSDHRALSWENASHGYEEDPNKVFNEAMDRVTVVSLPQLKRDENPPKTYRSSFDPQNIGKDSKNDNYQKLMALTRDWNPAMPIRYAAPSKSRHGGDERPEGHGIGR